MFVHCQALIFAFVHLLDGLRLRDNVSIFKSIERMQAKSADWSQGYPKQQCNSNIQFLHFIIILLKYKIKLSIIINLTITKSMKSLFIVGPSGSGKTTLSHTLRQIYEQTFGSSTVSLVNLDPANYLSQNKNIQVNELVTIQDIMQEYQIGPNGAILYAMDFVLENIEWLEKKIASIILKIKSQPQKDNIYHHLFIFDLPGQIELYINTDTVRKILQKITLLISNESGTSPCLIELFDCTYMHDVNQFISLCMMSLSTMINLQMPHINLLNKIDIIKSSQNKPSRGLLNEYFRVTSALQLVQQLKSNEDENETNAQVIAKVLDTYGQVTFMPCSVYNKDLITSLIYQIQKVCGTLELSLYHNKFMELVKDVDDFALDRAITNIENDYYEEQQEGMERFNEDLEKQKHNR